MSTGRGKNFVSQITVIAAEEARKANSTSTVEGSTTVSRKDELGMLQRDIDTDPILTPGGVVSTLVHPINYRSLGGLPGEMPFKPCTPVIDWDYTPEQISYANKDSSLITLSLTTQY